MRQLTTDCQPEFFRRATDLPKIMLHVSDFMNNIKQCCVHTFNSTTDFISHSLHPLFAGYQYLEADSVLLIQCAFHAKSSHAFAYTNY